MSRVAGPVAGERTLAALLVCLVCAAGGCRSRSAEDFIPSELVAHAAVDAALTAWRDGRTEIEPLASADATVHVELVDNFRPQGRALSDFQILGETPAHNARAFVVQLRLTNPREVVKCRYFVVGIDPLWVFRQEDYDMLSHWDHVMTAEDDAPDSPAPAASDQAP